MSLSPAAVQGLSEEHCFSLSQQESQAKSVALYRSMLQREQEEGNWVGHVLNISARVQGGPSCGLVALRICAEYLRGGEEEKNSGAELLDFAKEKGFTAMGEMFSAVDLCEVAVDYYGLKEAKVVQPLTGLKLLRHLSRGRPALVPYDNDKNNTPCKKQGHCAHWAAVIGFMLPWSVWTTLFLQENRLLQSEEEEALHFTQNHHLQLVEGIETEAIEKMLEESLKVVAQQSKSRHRALWNYRDLKASNANLQTPNPQKVKEELYYIPSVLHLLQHHIILL